MNRPPPRSTRTDTLLPYTTLFRSVLRGQVSVEQGGADDILRARLAPFGGALQIGKGACAVALLEHQKAQIVLGAGMALFRGLAIPVDGERGIGLHAATQLDRKSTRLNSSH